MLISFLKRIIKFLYAGLFYLIPTLIKVIGKGPVVPEKKGFKGIAHNTPLHLAQNPAGSGLLTLQAAYNGDFAAKPLF